MRNLLFVFSAACFALLGSSMQAQTAVISPASALAPAPQSSAAITGTVTAPNGNVIVGAQVTLVSKPSKSQQTTLTDGEGSFHFPGLATGAFQITVTANGFAPWVGRDFDLAANQQYQVPDISLEIESANTTVHAVFSGYDLAEQQLHLEEKQRVLGVFPNFYASYVWKAEPLTAGQKFRLAWRSAIDPVTFLSTGAVAGIQQWNNDFEDYGQGASGYAKRYGANYADGFIGLMLGGAVFPSILHQDPRYFYKGTGSIRSRAIYALSTVVITRGDNGRWQPNYSNVLGTFAAGGISNAYYPANDRGVGLTVENSLIGLAVGGGAALLQEFLIKKLRAEFRRRPPCNHKRFRDDSTFSSTVSRMRRIQHLQLIPTLNSCSLDRSRRQFNHRMDPPAHAADSPRSKLRPHRAYAQRAVERDHIDRKPHPEGMHTRRWLDPEARIWFEPLSSQQSDQPSEACIRNCDPGSDHSLLRRIPDCYLRPLDDFLLSRRLVRLTVLSAATPIF